MNFQHKYDLVEAEKRRVLGQLEAIDWYERAIVGARNNKYLQEEALAYELAAKYYLGRGMDKIAQLYMKEAHYRYQQWGAVVKVEDLEERYPQLLAQKTAQARTAIEKNSIASVMTSTTRRTDSSILDLDSMMKAFQTLSGEIVLNRLLEKIMQTIIENAGAERGLLILEKKLKGEGEVEWLIEAEGTLNVDKVTVLQSLPLEGALPTAIFNYVLRTCKPVVLANAMNDDIYIKNRYIQKNKLKSVLCSPIIYQGKRVGILYLENNVTEGAFTPARLKLLDMLSSLAAISIENARLYKTLEEKVEERTAQLNAKIGELTQIRQELIQNEKMASLGRLVAGFSHELNTPIGVAVGTASILRQKSQLINQLLEQEEVDEEEFVSALSTINEASELTLSNLRRAAGLINSFKRTAVDQTSERVWKFEVKTTLEDVINTLRNQFRQTNIEIQLDCPNDLNIYSIPGALDQVLTNLILNSLKHGFKNGTIGGRIMIRVRLEEKRLQIDYSDTGIGIAAKALEKVFEPFFTTNRAQGGSGLGMYICYNIVTSQLNGTMTCESILGKGVLFRIEFPVAFSLAEAIEKG
jgi:signal transduction histidine kinase